jgi:hypothetical protein
MPWLLNAFLKLGKEMEEKVLTDKNQFPTKEAIFSHIGKSKIYWESFFQQIHENYPDFSEQWRYYNDGKSWLLKVTRKSKTIFWLSVLKGLFRVTFYFSDKAAPAIMESSISDELKEKFKNGKRYNKIRGITLIINNKKVIEYAKSLINIKLSVK